MKKVGQMLADIFLVVMLETPEPSGMEENQDDHNFRIVQTVRFVSMAARLVFYQIFFLTFRKFLAKIVCHTINPRNFTL